MINDIAKQIGQEVATKYTNESIRNKLKDKIMAGSKGGKPGQWSARKAQLLASEYKKAGGGYKSGKSKPQKSLDKWTKEEWGTKSGKRSQDTGERYLPKKAREALTPSEYAATTKAKREGTKEGKQFVKQPKKIADKTARYR
jgi:hypothetical protein